MSAKKMRNKVERLLNSRNFDPEMRKFEVLTRKCVAFHGTAASDVFCLAEQGEFSRPNSDLQDHFYAVPNTNNVKMRTAIKTLGISISDDFNPLETAAGYAETSSMRRGDEGTTRLGVVITFGQSILRIPFSVVTCDEVEPELELERAPTLEDIHAIYPISSDARLFIARGLRTQAGRAA